MKKLFIVLEGLSGSGKSTLCKLLAAKLPAILISTPSPKISEIRKTIDEGDLQTRFLYYLASVSYASEEIRRSLLTSHVICDRYILSTLCYHRAAGIKIDVKSLAQRLQICIPDLTFLIDAPHQLRESRIANRKEGNASSDAWERANRVDKKTFRLMAQSGARLITNNNLPEEAVLKILREIQKLGDDYENDRKEKNH